MDNMQIKPISNNWYNKILSFSSVKMDNFNVFWTIWQILNSLQVLWQGQLIALECSGPEAKINTFVIFNKEASLIYELRYIPWNIHTV